ncbi:hypothetical protein [Streptomyces sp. NPDC093060]
MDFRKGGAQVEVQQALRSCGRTVTASPYAATERQPHDVIDGFGPFRDDE